VIRTLKKEVGSFTEILDSVYRLHGFNTETTDCYLHFMTFHRSLTALTSVLVVRKRL